MANVDLGTFWREYMAHWDNGHSIVKKNRIYF